MSNPDFKPLLNVCEFLNGVHIYCDEASRGVTRYVSANHYCSHVKNSEVRQCLIYDSAKQDARIIGIEYMIPKNLYLTLSSDEQKLWHSHEFEVKSGALILPYSPSSGMSKTEWQEMETKALSEVINLYGKTWHFWQVDRGDKLPLGFPVLMGSLTNSNQINLDKALSDRDEEFGVNYSEKAKIRESIPSPDINEMADSWWKTYQ